MTGGRSSLGLAGVGVEGFGACLACPPPAPPPILSLTRRDGGGAGPPGSLLSRSLLGLPAQHIRPPLPLSCGGKGERTLSGGRRTCAERGRERGLQFLGLPPLPSLFCGVQRATSFGPPLFLPSGLGDRGGERSRPPWALSVRACMAFLRPSTEELTSSRTSVRSWRRAEASSVSPPAG